MRTLLVVAYFYPPHKGIGGKRIARLARRLPERGWRPLVLTTPTPPPKDLDPGQQADPPGVEVLRSYCPEAVFRLYAGTNAAVASSRGGPGERSLLARAVGYAEGLASAYYPIDPKIWFTPFAAASALAVARRRRVDAALVTAAPYSSLLVGLALKRAGVPLIVDLRDPWSFNFEMEKKAPAMRAAEAALEARVLRAADYVIFASDATRRRYEELYPALSGRARALYSGFEKDPPGAPRGAWPAPPRPKVGIIHFGEFYGPRRLGRFIDALAAVTSRRGLSPAELGVLCLGGAASTDLAQADVLGVSGFLSERPALPYEEGLAALRGADALLYCDPGRERYFVAGKLFDYLRVGRPILAITASDELKGLVEGRGVGLAADPDDQAALEKLLEAALSPGGVPYDPRGVDALSADRSADTLVEVLERVGSR